MKIRRLLSVIICIFLFIGSVQPVWAAEDDSQEGQSTPEYSIRVSTNTLSFGTVHQGSEYVYFPITITNVGQNDISMAWNIYDSEHNFYVDAPDTMYLPSGSSSDFNIACETKSPTGSYSATLLIGSEEDYLYLYGVTINISATIVADEPVVNAVYVYPGNVEMNGNSGMSFQADVRGENNPNTDVTWSVSGCRGNTTIDQNGYLFVASNERSDSITVKATSVQTPSVFGTAQVSILSGNYTLSVQSNPTNGGVVSGGGSYRSGDNASLYASSNNGFRFTNWSCNGSNIGNNPSLTVNNIQADANYIANFTRNTCYIRVDSNHGNAGSITASQDVGYNDSFTLSAKPNNGYRFDYWKEGDQIISRDMTHTMNNITSDHKYTAYFSATTHTINIVVNPQDTGSVSGQGTYADGCNVTVSANAYQGYQFTNWILNGNTTKTDSSLTINNLNQDYNLIANFVKITNPSQTPTPVPPPIAPTATPKPVLPKATVKPVTEPEATAAPSAVPTSTSQTEPVIPDTDQPDNPDEPPTPEQYDALTGVLQSLNLSEPEARALISSGQDSALLSHAAEEGYLSISIHNEYSDASQSGTNNYKNNVSFPDFPNTLSGMLDEEEKISLLKGEPYNINMDIFDNTNLQTQNDHILKQKAEENNLSIGSFFEIILMKAHQGSSQMITEIPTSMKIVLKVPDHLKNKERQFYIARSHQNRDGELEISFLRDEDYDPNTITFHTDCFSSYAITYAEPDHALSTDTRTIRNILIGALFTLTVVFSIVFFVNRHNEKLRRKYRSNNRKK